MDEHLRDAGLQIRGILASCGPMGLWQLQSLLRCSRAETRLALACLAAQGTVRPFQLEERLCFRLEETSGAPPAELSRARRGRRSRAAGSAILFAAAQ